MSTLFHNEVLLENKIANCVVVIVGDTMNRKVDLLLSLIFLSFFISIRPHPVNAQANVLGLNVSLLALNASGSAVVNEQVEGHFIMLNENDFPIHFDMVGVGGRGPGCLTSIAMTCFVDKEDFYTYDEVILQPGEFHEFRDARSFSTVGTHFFQPTARLANCEGDECWYTLGSIVFLEIVEAETESGIGLTTPLSINPTSPTNNENVTAQFTLYNSSSESITIEYLTAAGRPNSCSDLTCQSSVYDFPIVENIILPAGGSYEYQESRTLEESGDIWFQISYKSNYWESLGDRRIVEVSDTPPDGIELISPIFITPSNPESGEAVAAEFTIRNSGSSTVNLEFLTVAGRADSCPDLVCQTAMYDFPLGEDISIAPGGYYTYLQSRTLADPGNIWFQASYKTDQWKPIGTRLDVQVDEGLLLTSPLAVQDTTPVANQQIRAGFILENHGTKPYAFRKIGVAVRGPSCEHLDFGCTSGLYDYEYLEDIVIAPGQTFEFRQGRSFSRQGDHFAWISVETYDGAWTSVGMPTSFAVEGTADNEYSHSASFNFDFGVHYHVQHEELADANRLALAHEVGAQHIRIGPAWNLLEPSDGNWSSEHVDELRYVVEQAKSRGMDVYMLLGQVPCWASADPDKNCSTNSYHLWYPPNDYDEYAEAFNYLVSEFKDDVVAFEIWNEPNRPEFWPPYPNAREYTDLMVTTYDRVKQQHPEVTLLGGSLGGTDVVFLEDMYLSGARGKFDALAVHPYTGGLDPYACENSRWSFKCGVEDMRRLMYRYNDDRSDMWFTEFGWTSYSGWQGVSEAQQAQYLDTALDIISQWDFVKVATWYNLIDGDGNTAVDHFGLYQSNSTVDRKSASDVVINRYSRTQSPTIVPDQTPIVFIPGIAGSVLRGYSPLTEGSNEFWPGEYIPGSLDNLSLHPGTENDDFVVYADDVVRNIFGIRSYLEWKTDYRDFIKYFEEQGYIEYKPTYSQGFFQCDVMSYSGERPTLFLFPYDWRLSNVHNGQLLEEYIECIRLLYPDTKVNLVTHSMGGLVARQYMLRDSNIDDVENLISIATPWLGAAKAVYLAETGNFLPFGADLIIANDSFVKENLPYFPGFVQLLPGESYQKLISLSGDDGVVKIDESVFASHLEDSWVTRYSHGWLPYADYVSFLDTRYENQIGTVSERFHATNGVDDWSNEQGHNYYHLVGRLHIEKTIERVSLTNQPKCYTSPAPNPDPSTHFMTCQNQTIMRLDYGIGDGTVPDHSATRIGNDGVQLNADGANVLCFNSQSVGQDEEYAHGPLPGSDDVLTVVSAILDGNPPPDGFFDCNDSNTLQRNANKLSDEIDATQLSLLNSTSFVLSDQFHNVIYDTDNPSGITTPGVTYDWLGGNNHSLHLSTVRSYQVTMTVGTDPALLEGFQLSDGEFVEGQRYLDLQSPVTTTAHFIVTTNGITLTQSEEISTTGATSYADQFADLTYEPAITVEVSLQSNQTVVSIHGDSPVDGEVANWYSLDGTTFVKYESPLSLPIELGSLFVFAEDATGNRSGIEEVLFSAPIPLSIYNSSGTAFAANPIQTIVTAFLVFCAGTLFWTNKSRHDLHESSINQ